MKIKIMTFNIRHAMDYGLYLKDGTDLIDYNVPTSIINEINPDILGLNEVYGYGLKEDYWNQTEKIGALTKMKGFFAPAVNVPEIGYFGNSILSKHIIKELKVIPIPEPLIKDEPVIYKSRCLLKAVIECGEKDITVFVTHFGIANGQKKNAVETLLPEIKKVDTPMILMGDFNLHPQSELLKPFYEIFNEVDEKNNELTFRSENPYYKVDYIFLSKDIKILKTRVIKKIASDHFALTAEVEI